MAIAELLSVLFSGDVVGLDSGTGIVNLCARLVGIVNFIPQFLTIDNTVISSLDIESVDQHL
jgi:hypothetical protein